jgi:hypothetical protein
MNAEQLKVALRNVYRPWLNGAELRALANVVNWGRGHPNHAVWLCLLRDGLAKTIAPTFGEPERFVFTQAGIDGVLAAEGKVPK